MTVNWVTRNIRRMVRKRGLERWETNSENCEATPQVIWPIAKSLSKRGGPKAPSEIHGPLGLIFYPIHKTNIIADCLENQFRAHDLFDCDRRRHVKALVETLLPTVDKDISVNFLACDVKKKKKKYNP
jgi:hypothetical protein